MQIQFTETMKGTYHLKEKPEQERTLFFDVIARIPRVRRFLKDFTADIDGEVTMAGIAERKPFHGTLEIALLTRRQLVYRFEFTGNDGEEYYLEGIKVNISPLTATKTMTTLYTKVYRKGEEIAEGILRFDLRELGDLISSIRVMIS